MEKIKEFLSSKPSDNEAQPAAGNTSTNPHGGASGLSGQGSHLAAAHETSSTTGAFPMPGTYETTPTLEKTGHNLGTDNTTSLTGTSHHQGPISGLGNPPPSGTGLGQSSDTGLGSTAASGPEFSSSQPKSKGLSEATTDQDGQPLNSGTGTTGNLSPDHHHSQEAAALGTAGAFGVGAASHDLSGGEQRAFPLSQSGHTSGTNRTSGLPSTTSSGTMSGQPGHNPALLDKADQRLGSAQTENGSGQVPGSAAGYGTTSSNPATSGAGYSSGTNLSASNISSDHHYGRDAAAAGTVGAGAYAAVRHHENQDQPGLGSTTSTTASGPHSSTVANKADPRVDSDRDGHSSLGSINQGYKATPSGQSSAYYGSPKGTAVGGPHQTQTANLLDPHVNTAGDSTRLEDAHHHSKKHGGGDEAADKHHRGRDTAAGASMGAGAADLAKHEHDKHKHSTGTGNTTLPIRDSTQNTTGASHSTGQPSLVDQRGTGSSGHHLGRDAVLGSGGAGLAQHEHIKHHHNESGSQATPIYDQMAVSKGTAADVTSSGHHYGRDAALGSGAVGTAALASHEYGKHQGTSDTKPTPALPGPAPNTAGPHNQDWMNKLDPRVKAKGDGTITDTNNSQHDSHASRNLAGAGVGAGTYEADKLHQKHDNPPYSSTTQRSTTGVSANTGPHASDITNKADPRADSGRSKEHHYGRDAAGVGAVGAGAVAYELNKHHDNRTSDPYSTHGVSSHEPLPTAPGNYGIGTGAGLQNTLEREGQTSQDHHYGRDAVTVGGAGALGAGAYEANKSHQSKGNEPGYSSTAGPVGTTTTTTTGPHSANIANKADPRVDSDRSKEHHYGRDAAGASAIGAGAYEADKHHQKKELEKQQKQHARDLEKDQKNVAKEHEKEQKKYEKEMAKEHKQGGKEEKKDHKGLFSFLKRDKSKKYTPEEEAEFDRQERENESHAARNTAAAAAAAGAGAGAGAYGAHEHSQMHGTGLDEKKPGTDLGDRLHGVDRNRGITHDHEGIQNTEPKHTMGDHHRGRDAAGVGAAGVLAEHEYKKHEGTSGQQLNTGSGYGSTSGQRGLSLSEASTDQDGNPLVGAGTTADHQPIGGGHHHERDTALATAAGETGALGTHDDRQHVGTSHRPSRGQTFGLPSTGKDHHYGKDAAGMEGANVLGSHEHQRHERPSGEYTKTHDWNDPKDPTSPTYVHSGTGQITHSSSLANKADPRVDNSTAPRSTGDSSYGSDNFHGTTGHSGTTHGAGYGESERNRLHKDPPASHPAARGVPSSTSETSRMINEGKQGLEQDTGVANSHGTNSASNY
ncbi:hypothetical protein BP6252_06148 [Coleophoma cylindrospora]|uniref:Uncharacterized protein n=1 Tax=Coleophoma cylindrospora TaxID=1849047 RepID=A0A3D8RM40_9HELO|nr:hypothetical protein BP6252_06148 [Coleophoma cylindrospora]